MRLKYQSYLLVRDPKTFNYRIKDGFEEWNEEQYQDWIDGDHLVRENVQIFSDAPIHQASLKNPKTALLIKQCPKDKDRHEKQQNSANNFDIVDEFLLKKEKQN